MEPLNSRQHLALAERLAASDRWGPAEEHYRAALAGDDPEVAAAAALRLGRRAEHINNWQAARTLYERSMAQGAADVRCRAGFFLGALHLVEGDNNAARAVLTVAGESPEDLIRPWALLRLGDACFRLEDFRGAYRAYTAASAAGNEQASFWADAQLVTVIGHLKLLDEAEAAAEAKQAEGGA